MLSLYAFNERAGKRWEGVAEEGRQRLTEQEIVPGNPGTILKDVDTWLEFVGPGGVVTKSRNATVPANRLPELNAKISHPIQLALKRPLLRDYPNLAGIFILLRVMDLLQMRGPRLAVSPEALDFWRRLNSTEQYFALLEALLFEAQSSVLGQGRDTGEEGQVFDMVTLFLGQLTDRWRDLDDHQSLFIFGPRGLLPMWILFLLQQLGFIEIRPRPLLEAERKRWVRGGWLVSGARLTPWGTAVTWALLGFAKRGEDQLEPEAPEPQGELWEGVVLPVDSGAGGPGNGSADMDLDEEPAGPEEGDEAGPEDGFGILQPVFQPYFPEWQTVYALPSGEVRSGKHIFKVTLGGWREDGGIWRRFAVPPETTLDDLAMAILAAFKFDNDHLYDFRYRDRRGKSRVYNHPYTDEGPFTTEITVGETDLALKDKMLFTFDYGDNWEFEVRLESVEAGPCRLRQPKVIESAGKAPKQYPQSDW